MDKQEIWKPIKVALFLLFILLMNVTLYGQTSDTLTSYNNEELQRIVTRVVRAKECDTLLKVAEQQLLVKDSIIAKNDSIVMKQDVVIATQDTIITNHETILGIRNKQLENSEKNLKKAKRKLKVTKLVWVTTTTSLIVLWLITSFN